MESKNTKTSSNTYERQYIINLQKNRSLFAVISSFISLFTAIYAITSGLILYARNGELPINLFQYFTIDTNSITALASAMIIPYAIEGFRKKRFYCPKWALIFYYSGTMCTTLIMIFAVFVISRVDIVNAFGGYNFYLHLICPTLILISFFLMESNYRFTIKDAALTVIPVFIYAIIYIYEVVIKGESAGGWEDIYYFTIYAHFMVSFVAMLTISFLLANILRFLYNKLNDIRMRKLVNGLWGNDVSLIEIKIEFFGLGRYFGKKEYKSHVTLPLDIMTIVSDKYNIEINELIRPFIRGMLDSLNNR